MLFTKAQLQFAQALTGIAYGNPFVVGKVRELEEEAARIDIGVPVEAVAVDNNLIPERPGLPLLLRRGAALIEHLLSQFAGGLSPEELRLYEDVCLLVLYFRFRDCFQRTVEESLHSCESSGVTVDYYQEYADEFTRILSPMGSVLEPVHLFACHFQIRRAYDLIYSHLFGNSSAVQKLRADIWSSVFTHDMRRYRVSLYNRMHEISTLITGESGTGKELVARAIGLSRYVPFDVKAERFTEPVAGAFHAVNLAALSPQLIESELFGHAQGAFTGAIKERTGWLEQCRQSHSVFLDEIGELASTLQVKLLRVLQNRTFERIGETQTRHFSGKVISATNRDFAAQIQAGRFRADVYYRLCADQIQTCSLREQIKEAPDELLSLIRFLAGRICPEEPEPIAEDVTHWIRHHLPADYPWPGNFRELEQCVRNVLVRREYHPLPVTGPERGGLLTALGSLQLSAAELSRVYATLVYHRTGSYVATGKILGVDRRTVKEWQLAEQELRELSANLHQ